jgi:hypothetical protein
MTRGANIEYNLDISPYKAITITNWQFVFSSQNHLEKFHKRLIEEETRIINSLSKRFGFKIKNCINIASVNIYKQIEQRGFLIINDKGVKFKNITDVEIFLDGVSK